MSAPDHIHTAHRMGEATYAAIDAVMQKDLKTPEERSEFLAGFLVDLLARMSMRSDMDKIRTLAINAAEIAAVVASEVLAARAREESA